jgi:dihydrofolate reductase
MNINLIVAMCKKTRGIGINNTLPWHISADLKRFQKLTIGKKKNAVIMGKNTWESLPKKPLNYRKNIILSSTLQNINPAFNQIKKQQVSIFNNFDIMLSNLERNDIQQVWIIGGYTLYEEALKRNLVSKIYLTNVLECKQKEFDVFFPEIPKHFYKTYCGEIKSEKYVYGPLLFETKYNYQEYCNKNI